jgi:hypothetical protein
LIRRRWFLSFVTGVLLLPAAGYCQVQGVLSKKWYGNWSAGIGGGPNIFFGDLKVNRYWPANSNMDEWRYAGSFYLIRQLSHVFALRGQVLYGELSGTKRIYKGGGTCSQYFDATVLEYNLNTTINFSNLLFRYKPKRIFFIYGTVGAGFSNWITKKKDLQTHQEIGGNGSWENWTTELVVPAGLGAYFNIHDRVNLGLEWTLRGVNSDRLDATVGGFPYDMYSFLSLNLVVNFNRYNPVKLDAVESSMPPVKLPRPENLIQKPQKAAPRTTPRDTGSVVKPAPGQVKELPQEQIRIIPPPVLKDTAHKEPPKTGTVQEKPAVIPAKGADVFYRVQVFASSNGQRTPESLKAYFKLSQPVTREQSEGYYRYYVGEFESEPEANQFADALRARPGLQGAFVVKYVNGRRELTHPK